MKKYLNFVFVFICVFFCINKVFAFECTLGSYTLTYDSTGKLTSASKSGTKITKNLESYFNPTKKADCPSESDATVTYIDSGRTLYVGRISKSSTITEGCMRNVYKDTCENDSDFACIWVEDPPFGESYCNVDNLIYVSCGDTKDIPYQAPKLMSFVVNLFKIATPIVLILIGMIQMIKALSQSKEDEIKKAKSLLIKKLIASVLIFFITYIVQFVIMKVADSSETDSISDCFNCFLNNNCEDNAYYKEVLPGGDVLTKYFNK